MCPANSFIFSNRYLVIDFTHSHSNISDISYKSIGLVGNGDATTLIYVHQVV